LESTLALPSGDSSLPSRSLKLGGLAAGVAGLMLSVALAAAYLGVRSGAAEWPPEGFKVDAFLGVMLTLTALMAASFAGWALWADARGQRRQAAAALTLAAFVGLCLLNGVWYLGTRIDLGAASSPYATMTYALLGGVGVLLAAGVIGLLAALAKVGGRQTGPGFLGVVQAAVWFWLLTLTAWIVVWTTLFLVK
jgi:cytochrome c oxidase subunit 3